MNDDEIYIDVDNLDDYKLSLQIVTFVIVIMITSALITIMESFFVCQVGVKTCWERSNFIPRFLKRAAMESRQINFLGLINFILHC